MRLVVVGEPDDSASMLLRILAGLSRPTAGRVEVAGFGDPGSARRTARVAYVGPSPGIHPWMTPREAVTLSARLVGASRSTSRRRVAEALDWVELPAAAADRPVRRAGPAVGQRADLAAALVGAPEVLLLDEPLRALPPEERKRLLRPAGRRLTMVVASRYPSSERGITSHAMVLRNGAVALLTTIAQLEHAGHALSREALVALPLSGHQVGGRGPAVPDRASPRELVAP